MWRRHAHPAALERIAIPTRPAAVDDAPKRALLHHQKALNGNHLAGHLKAACEEEFG
jgi:hypothetical protein